MTDDEVKRLQLVWARTLEALRALVQELGITEKELHAAGDYFNRLGQSGMFPSLLDVGLAMTSIAATERRVGTRRNLEGPFYRAGAPLRPEGNLLDRIPSRGSTKLRISGRVTDATNGQPLPGVELDVWQADENGVYDQHAFHLRGRVLTNHLGLYELRTIVPNDYSQHDDDPIGELFRKLGRHNYRAAHIHMKFRIGGREVLTTQLFMADSPYIDSDYVVGAVSDDLIVTPVPVVVPSGETELVVSYDFALPVATDE